MSLLSFLKLLTVTMLMMVLPGQRRRPQERRTRRAKFQRKREQRRRKPSAAHLNLMSQVRSQAVRRLRSRAQLPAPARHAWGIHGSPKFDLWIKLSLAMGGTCHIYGMHSSFPLHHSWGLLSRDTPSIRMAGVKEIQEEKGTIGEEQEEHREKKQVAD